MNITAGAASAGRHSGVAMIHMHAKKLVTVVCETALQRLVLETLHEAGAGGYTTSDT